MPKQFTDADISDLDSLYRRIYAEREDLILDELPWQKAGLTWTASGYGAKIATPYKIRFNDRAYRLYSTCYSNVASIWFTTKGRKIYVS